jgi:hypothetical protein
MPPRRPFNPNEIAPMLRPVPAGQSSIAQPRPVLVSPNSASPNGNGGIPGRPGVAPRPGIGVPGQGYQQRPGQPPAPGQPVSGAPVRRPAGNGVFRALPGGTAAVPVSAATRAIATSRRKTARRRCCSRSSVSARAAG